MALLSYDDRDGEIWFNGEFTPWRDTKLHVLSHGLHYASCVFEGERVYGGNIFKLTEHTARLHTSAELMGFEIPYSVAEIDAACNETVARNGIVDGYVRPFAWRGSEMMAVSAQNTTIHVVIATWPWPAYFGDGWIAIRLDLGDTDWDGITAWLRRSWAAIAPKRLAAEWGGV